MKEYSATNRATDRVIGISDKEARDIRYALSKLEGDDSVELDINVAEAKEVLEV